MKFLRSWREREREEGGFVSARVEAILAEGVAESRTYHVEGGSHPGDTQQNAKIKAIGRGIMIIFWHIKYELVL